MSYNNKLNEFWDFIEELNLEGAKRFWEKLNLDERNTIRLNDNTNYGMAIVPAQVEERWDIFRWLIIKKRIRMEYGIGILAIRAGCDDVAHAIFKQDLGYRGNEDIHCFITETLDCDEEFTEEHIIIMLDYASRLIDGTILYKAFKKVNDLIECVHSIRDLSLRTILSAYSVSLEDEAEIRDQYDENNKDQKIEQEAELEKVYNIRKQIIKALLTYITDSAALDNGEPGINQKDELIEYKKLVKEIVNNPDFLTS